jgi:hypothetical protein
MPENIMEKIENKIEKSPLVKDFSQELSQVKKNPKKKLKTIILTVVIILAGITSGYFLSQKGGGPTPVARDVAEGDIETGMTVGVADEKTFKDSAEGELVAGGLDGEGSHHLRRPGGDTQNVYLTSSIVDLDKFVGRQVKVWGETFSASKAGWLMDVGKLQVL